MDIESGCLSMSPDTGWVRRRIDRGDGCDIEWEGVGPICDPDACPFGLETDWEALLNTWNDSRDGSHRREAEAAYYFGIDPARLN